MSTAETPETPRDMAARHRNERRRLRSDTRDETEYRRAYSALIRRQADERDAAFSPSGELPTSRRR